MTDAVTIDVSGREPGPLGLAELEPGLAQVQEGDIVFIYSDNSRNWGTPAYWTGFSYPDPEAARALIAKGISAIGFDGPSADPVDSTTYDLHRIWLSAGPDDHRERGQPRAAAGAGAGRRRPDEAAEL